MLGFWFAKWSEVLFIYITRSPIIWFHKKYTYYPNLKTKQGKSELNKLATRKYLSWTKNCPQGAQHNALLWRKALNGEHERRKCGVNSVG